mgnify:CR=1 FL=1
MVRKITHIALVLLLVSGTTGFAISAHFCQETLVEISLGEGTEPCCDDMTGTCCQDEITIVQLDLTYLSSSPTTLPHLVQVKEMLPDAAALVTDQRTVTTAIFSVQRETGPPLIPTTPRLLAGLQSYLL